MFAVVTVPTALRTLIVSFDVTADVDRRGLASDRAVDCLHARSEVQHRSQPGQVDQPSAGARLVGQRQPVLDREGATERLRQVENALHLDAVQRAAVGEQRAAVHHQGTALDRARRLEIERARGQGQRAAHRQRRLIGDGGVLLIQCQRARGFRHADRHRVRDRAGRCDGDRIAAARHRGRIPICVERPIAADTVFPIDRCHRNISCERMDRRDRLSCLGCGRRLTPGFHRRNALSALRAMASVCSRHFPVGRLVRPFRGQIIAGVARLQ